MINFNCLIYYSKLSLSDEDNDFVSYYLEQGCKIINREIDEKYGERFKVNIDYLYLDRGDVGLKKLYGKIKTYNDLFFTHSHVINKHNEKLVEYLSTRKHFFLHSKTEGELKNEIDNNMISLAKSGGGIKLEIVADDIKNNTYHQIYHLHHESKRSQSIISKHGSRGNYQSILLTKLQGKQSDETIRGIKLQIREIFSNLQPDDLIVIDVNLIHIKEIFDFLEGIQSKNKVISLFGTIDGRFKKISFNLINTVGSNLVSSLSNLDLLNKIFPKGVSDIRRNIIADATYRLEIPLLISEVLNKCTNNNLTTIDENAIRKAFLSYDGERDIFLGKNDDYAFNQNGSNIIKNTSCFTYPCSIQFKDYDTPKILHKYQYDQQLNKRSVIYSYIDIERVFNIDIQSGTWTASFFIDLISESDNPIEEIIFNNLSESNGKLNYKLIFEKSDNNNYSTKRYYITAKFDFLPVADNFPFDWQNIYLSQTSKNSKKYILQPTPQKLIDNDFDIGEWIILESFTGIKNKKNYLFKGADLSRTVEINKENRVGWILKRKNTATLLKIGIPLFFLIYLVYYSTSIDYTSSRQSIGILTTTFLSAIALYFSVEKPQPKKMTIIDIIFVWFYLVNGITIISYGSSSVMSAAAFGITSLILKIFIPASLIGLGIYLYKRIKENRKKILLDREI